MTAPTTALAQPSRAQLHRAGKAALRKSIDDYPGTQRQLAAALGVNECTVSEWRNGKRYPDLQRAAALAEILGDHLGTVVRAYYERTCELCGRVTYQGRSGSPKVYCSRRCKALAFYRRERAKGTMQAYRDRNDLQAHQLAVAAYCRGCEPDGVCRTITCPLRGVSPYPYYERVQAVAL